MMMESSWPMVWGMHFEVFLMIVSGVFYLLCAFLLWKPFRQEKNELIGALFAFLAYQSISMFFMGIEMHTMNMAYGYIATLAVLIGSVYMLRFVFSPFSKAARRILFLFCMVAVLAIFSWFVQTPERSMQMMHFTLWYDIIVNGIVVGGAIILMGLKVTGILKLKAFGGGTGVVSCCVVANGAMLTGAMLTSAMFQFLAPLLILGTLFVSRKNQQSQ